MPDHTRTTAPEPAPERASLIEAERWFAREMDDLRRKMGDDAGRHTFCVLTGVIRWLRCSGHGSLTLSAIEHKFSNKIKAETILTAEEKA